MKKNVDYRLFFAVLSLIIFWMIMISSVSVYSSFRVTNLMAAAWLIENWYNHFYVIRNILHVIISMVLLWILVKIPYNFFEKYSKYFYLWCLFLLIVVLSMWQIWNWAKWWINLPFLPFAIQPTEFLKFALIINLATFLKKYKWVLHTFENGFLPFMLILFSSVILVWLQPDFWTILVIVPISIIMFFYAWANIKYLWILFIMGLIFSVSIYSIWNYDKVTWKNLNSLWYVTQRIDNFLAENEEAIKNKTINYQTEQALIAIWSWWFKWLGFWWSIQKYWYLPEVQWDFVFSVIIEELWFIWWFIILLIYLYIWYRWFYIASKVDDLFAKYVCIWVSSWILIQAFINIWVNLNIFPLTWITLPFISYWGSSLISLIIWLAILLNISRYMENKTTFSRLQRNKFMF